MPIPDIRVEDIIEKRVNSDRLAFRPLRSVSGTQVPLGPARDLLGILKIQIL